jgi:hypothetical protein
MRFHHYEQRRQEKLNIVLAERARIITDELDGIGLNSNRSPSPDSISRGQQHLVMMEHLLDKEAKRLERVRMTLKMSVNIFFPGVEVSVEVPRFH